MSISNLGYNHKYVNGVNQTCKICFNNESFHVDYNMRELLNGVAISDIEKRLKVKDQLLPQI